MNMEENKYMFITEKKAHARINEFFEYRYRDRINLSEWQFAEDDGALGNYPPKQSPSHAKEVVIGDRWEGRDLYAWLSKEVTLPEDWPSNKSIVGGQSTGRVTSFDSQAKRSLPSQRSPITTSFA